MTTIKEEIEQLKALLTGDLFADGELMMQIYELKKQLNPAIAENPMLEEEEECLYCGS
jgi:DNA-directed RNA polymerase specialized sigma54-like protein